MDNITTATPAEIDTELSELSYKHFVAATRAAQYFKLAEEYAAKGDYHAKYTAPSYQKQAEEYAATAEELSDKIAPLNAEFSRRGGWTRAFLVVNSNGHVHKSRSCTTCFADTRYAWMAKFSGLDEDQIVDAAGCRACTVCYPSAPVSVLNQPTRMFTPDEEAAQARKAELAAKKEAAAKAAVRDAITGEVLFKTERAARNEISRLLGVAEMYEDIAERRLALGYVIHLANHLGVDARELSAELQDKAAVKFRKEAIKIAKQNLASGFEMHRDPANWHDSIRRIAKEEGLI